MVELVERAVDGAPDSSETVTVSFAPTDAASASGTLELTDINDPDTDTLKFSLSGTGTESDVSFAQATADFGSVAVGSSESQELTLTNDGNGELDVGGVTVEGSDQSAFSVSGTPGTIGAGGSAELDVTTTHTTRGGKSAILNVTNESGDTVATASLGVVGTAPDSDVSSTVDFDDTRVKGVSSETVEVSNTGNVPLEVSSLEVSGDDASQFTVARDSLVVPAGSTESVTVAFQPAANRTTEALRETGLAADLTLTTNASDETVALSGTPITPDLSVSSKSLQYGAVPIGDPVNRTVTIRNSPRGTAPVNVTSLAVGGADTDSYSIADDVDGTLAPGQSEEITVTLNATSRGQKFGTLAAFTDDPREDAKTVFLTNTRTRVLTEFGSVDLTYLNPARGPQPEVDVTRGQDVDAELRKYQVTTDPNTSAQDFTSNLTFSETPFTAESELRNVDTFRYMNASVNRTSQFENATFTFGVSKAALAERDIARSNVTLYHNDTTGGYEALETTEVGETRTQVVYTATADEFSVFAIGGPRQQSSFELDSAQVSPTSVNTGETVNVTVDVENVGTADGDVELAFEANGDSRESRTVSVDTGDTQTVRVPLSFDSAGDYTLVVEGGGEERTAGTVTVTRDSSGGGGGGGGGDSDDDDAPPAEIEPVVPPVSTENGATSVSVQSVRAGQTIVVNVPETTSTEATTIEQVNVTSNGDALNAGVSVSPEAQPTDGTPANDRSTSTLGYVNVSLDNLDSPDTTRGSFKFSVSDQRLDELDATPSNVVMYRYNDGSWQSIETTHLGGDRYRANTSGFSWFAIGTADASISVTDATLSATAAEAGEEVAVNATLENTGDVAGDITLDLTADGRTVDSRTVTVEAGTTAVETFRFTQDRGGEYDISVNGVAAGSLTVAQTGAGTPTTADGASGQSGVETGGLQPLNILIIIVVVTLIGAAAYSLREQSG